MIKITTDSTCDLPARLLEQYDITVFPLGVVKAGRLYHDGVDIRTADIAAQVEAGGEITTTNAVNAADYEETFRTLTGQYDAVLHINIGSGFSCCCQNARLAAEEAGLHRSPKYTPERITPAVTVGSTPPERARAIRITPMVLLTP